MLRRLAVGLLLTVAILRPLAAAADVVELTGGERLEGKVAEVTAAGVVVEVGGQTVKFDPGKVRAIYFGAIGAVGGPPAPPLPPGAPPPPPPPVSTAAGAVQLLQTLRSTVAGGTTLREYGAKVSAIAPLVELYLAGLPPGAGGGAIGDALRYYVLAELAWSNQGAASRTVWLKKDDALARCAGYQDFARAMQDKGEAYYSERTKNYIVIADSVVPVLWSCAAQKIAEAERLAAINAAK